MIITIDGPTASGKSTIARLLADKLGALYINSGLLFRAIGYLVQKKDRALAAPEVLESLLVDQELVYEYSPVTGARIIFDKVDITPFLKTSEIDSLASRIATNSTVRTALLRYQRTLAQNKNVVADGRDCGTVVFPFAEYKFFITADSSVRAERWQLDQERAGIHYTLAESKRHLEERDRRDSDRTQAPLTIPENAVVIDTSTLTIDQAVTACLDHVKPLNDPLFS